MGQKKRKPREIHVDNLVIKADKVILEKEDRPTKSPEREPDPQQGPEDIQRDPWGFPMRRMPESENREENQGDDDQNKGEEQEDRRGSWI